MDPYYQQGGGSLQQQQQPLHHQQQQLSGGSRAADLAGLPSAPQMQSAASLQGQMLGQQGQQQQQPQLSASMGHQSGAGYQQQSQPQQHSSQGRHSQQQQQPSSVQSYLDSQTGGYGGMPVGGGGGGPHGMAQQQQQPLPLGSMNGMHHSHHGGQAPLPPGAHSSSSGAGRYSHRQAALHQHRSSAAAISDPMMGATITDQLASASGPLTGSGSALNQLGGGGGGYQLGQPAGGFAGPADRYPHHRSADRYTTGADLGGGGGGYPQPVDSVYPQPQSQLSRYDGHYLRGGSSGGSGLPPQSRHTPATGQSYPGASSTASGAYHLDWAAAEQQQQQQQLLNDSRYYPQSGQPGALHQQQQHHHHQSLGGAGSLNPASHLMMQPVFGPTQLGGSGGAGSGSRDLYVTELRARLQEAQNSYVAVKRELETATQKLGSSMHSIKSFWSPELKKERALRKEEQTKYALVNDQMKLMRVEVQKQALLIRQLEDELRLAHETRIRTTDPDIQQHIDALCMEKEGLFKENCLLRETIRELEMRIETQKQTLAARDDSIRKMVEMMNNKGIATKIMEDERMEMDRIKTRNIELEARLRHYETIIETKEKDIIKNDNTIKGSLSRSLSLHDTTINSNKTRDHQLKCLQPKPETETCHPKSSPVPRQRKSKLSSKAERFKSGRLASNKNNNNNQPPSKERLNEIMIKSSSSMSSSISSSGVSSSKSSSDLAANGNTSHTGQLQQPDTTTTTSNAPKTTTNTDNRWQQRQSINGAYQLCRCPDCMQSGQQIYSIRRKPPVVIRENAEPAAGGRQLRPPMAPVARKAVSFRSSVEHIGSPRSGRPMSLGRALNDELEEQEEERELYTSRDPSPQPPVITSTRNGSDHRWDAAIAAPADDMLLEEESCYSLHCTKDMSQAAYSHNENNYDDDYLRPLDCSTPKGLRNETVSSSNQLVRAEVHHPPPLAPQTTKARPDYTCLCSPDFLCVHNYPHLQPQQQRSISNELYGTTGSRSDYQLSRNCVDCKNLSTYVNLSATTQPRTSLSNQAEPTSAPASSYLAASQAHARLSLSSQQHMIKNSNAKTNGGSDYGSLEYIRQLKSKQNDVYGNVAYGAIGVPTGLAPNTDEQMQYLSAARRLQQTLNNCELCKRQLQLGLGCTCSANSSGQTGMLNGSSNQLLPSSNSRSMQNLLVDQQQQQQQQQQDLSLSNKSYHTATSSSLLDGSTFHLQQRQRINGSDPAGSVAALINASELSVLPVGALNNSISGPMNMSQAMVASGATANHSISTPATHQQRTLNTSNNVGGLRIDEQQQQQQQPFGGGPLPMNPMSCAANGIDSSLSSLFVYRHASDDNQEDDDHGPDPDQFDPDSLEISGSRQLGKQSQPERFAPEQQRPPLQLRNGTGSTNGASWLKARPASEYISLSSTTSSISASKPSGKTNQAGTSRASQPNGHNRSNNSSNNNGRSNTTCNNNAGLMQVGSDLTQSSLAKRRHLSHMNLQQQQQQQSQPTGGNKRKLLANSRSNSRSSPNVSSATSSASSKNNNNNSNQSSNSSRNSNGKLSIYQCFKNHLLDMAGSKSSTSNLHSTSLPNNNVNKLNGSASLPRNLTSGSLSAPSAKNHRLGSSKIATAQMEELRAELAKRDQDLLTMNAKMKVLEEQQRDSQRHIRVLKDSLVAKEEHYNLLLTDVEELRRNLDDRNKLIEKKSFQQTLGKDGRGAAGGGYTASYQELQELQGLLELRDKKIGDLQRRVMQLDQLLAEREAQLERVRVRFEHSAGGGGGPGNHPDMGLLNHYEESLGDKEKQISMIRDQRDRAEHELNEERDSHERSIKEYKMKLNSLKFEMDKLQSRLNKTNLFEGKYGSNVGDSSFGGGCGGGPDRFGANDQSSALIKRLELDKRSLQLECDRLRDKLESCGGAGSLERRRIGATGSSSASGGMLLDRASSALGDYSVVEFERLQEALEGQKQELRRAQAECRMNEMERKRAQEEADKLSERYERTQAEMHKLKAKLENATSEREQLMEDYERQQQLISRSQTERDCALADINQLKMDNERLQAQFNKNQLQAEKLQAQAERTQLEYKKLEDRFTEASEELHRLQGEKSSAQRELKTLEMSLESAQMQQQRLQQERDSIRIDLDKVREKHDRLESEMERYLHDKEFAQQQVAMFKERLETHQQQVVKLTKEREQMSLEIHELRERLHKQQKLQDTSQHETRNEVRIWKEKYERLLAQFEKLNQEMMAKEKESQMVMDKLQRVQSEAVKLEGKLEQSEMDRERTVIEVEKLQQLNAKAKEEHKKWQEELQQLQEMYTKTNTKLLKLSEVEEKLRIDYDKCQMDLEVLRERYEKLQLESRKLQSERDRLQVEHERIRFDNKRIQQSQGSQQATQEDFIRVQSEVDRLVAKLEQYQREMNKLQLEKERLILDSKSMVQQTEQQYQQQVVKLKSNEEKAMVELERARLQLEKVQAKYEQMNVDQEKLVADKERLQQQLLLLQQEVDKFRSQQSSSVQETKKLHDDEMQRVLQELETIREKYTQQRKELLQLRELQQNHDIDKDILKRELESAEQRLEKLNQSGSKQKQDSERCMIEIEKMRDKIERKQQELVRTQKERNQFAQEITVLHQQIQQLQVQYDQLQQQQQHQEQKASAAPNQPQQVAAPQQVPQGQQQPTFKPEEINKLKQMLVKSENDLQKTMAENQRFQMEVERLKLQLDDAAEYIGKIEGDNKLLAKQNQEIIQQLKQVQQQQQQSAASGGAQQAQQASQQQQEAMQQEMKKMQDVIKKSSHEIQMMVEERNKMQEMNKELQRNMEQTKVEFNSTMDQYEAELQRLQQEAQQRQQQQQQQQGQSQQQQADTEYKVKFEKAVEAIRAFQKSSDDMKKEIIKLNERNKKLSDQNQQLIQSLQSAEETLSKKGGGGESAAADSSGGGDAGEQEQLRQKLAQLNELCGKLDRDLRGSQEEIQKHQQANQQLKQILEKSQSEITNLKTERDRFQSQLEKLMVELERREDEMANLQAQQEKSGQNLQAKQGELVSFQKQLEEREKALEMKRDELQNLSKQIQQSRQQQQPQAPAAGQQQQQEMIAKLQQQIKSLEEERNKLRGELERVRNELKQTQAELERLLTILTNSEEEKFNLTQQIEQLQAKLKSMPGPTSGSAGQQPAQSQVPKGQPHPGGPQQQQQQQQVAQQQQQQQRAGQQQQPPQQQQARPPPQQPPQQQQQQQKPAGQGQRPSGGGASGFISGFFQ